jgi:hypothetical protein
VPAIAIVALRFTQQTRPAPAGSFWSRRARLKFNLRCEGGLRRASVRQSRGTPPKCPVSARKIILPGWTAVRPIFAVFGPGPNE